MHVLIVTFELEGLDDRSYRAQVEAVAPDFVRVPGLLTKIWLADEAATTYGGVYLFESREAIDRYLASETVAAMRSTPSFTNLTARVFDTIEAATWLTQGRLRLYPDRSAA